MEVLLKIAFRNLREHRAKTLIIGSIVALGLLALVVGNSLLDGAESGIRMLYTENFTGQVLIASARNDNPSLFIGGGGRRTRTPTPVIQDYRDLKAYLGGLPWIEKSVSQAVGFAAAEVDGQGSSLVQLYGVEPEEYLSMFPDTVTMLSGRFLHGDETGIVLSESQAASIGVSSSMPVAVGSKILLTSVNAVSGTKVREVEVRGIFRFERQTPNLTAISYIDLASLRALMGLTKMADVAVDLSTEERVSLGKPDEAALFGEGSGLVAVSGPPAGPRQEAELLSVLGDTSDAELYRAVNPDAFHFVLLKLARDKSPDAAIAELNRRFAAEGLPIAAHGWVEASGHLAEMVVNLKRIFNGLILIVAVVAVIIIMNTLVISVTERIAEIGTMRAVGAPRSFVRLMITLETLMVSFFFGLVGLALGALSLVAIGALRIQAEGFFTQIIFGGPVLRPSLSALSLLASFVAVMAVGVLASLYPVAVALRIAPVTAMGRH